MDLTDLNKLVGLCELTRQIVGRVRKLGDKATDRHWEIAHDLIFDGGIFNSVVSLCDLEFSEDGSYKDEVLAFLSVLEETVEPMKIFTDDDYIDDDSDDGDGRDFYADENIEYIIEDDGDFVSLTFGMHGHNFSDFRINKHIARSIAEDLLELCENY